MKKTKLFAKIIYYVFTFIIGILLALFLPYILYLDNSDAINIVGDELNSGNFDGAMKMVGGYYRNQPVFSEEFADGGGVVLFEAAVLNPVESGDVQIGDKLGKSYAGFLYGVASTYKVGAQSNNKSAILLTDNRGEVHKIEILNFDSNNDGSVDTSATFLQKGFILLDFNIDIASTLQSAQLIDCDGEVFKTLVLNLDFSGQFFADVEPLIEKYNFYVDEYAADHSDANAQYLKGLEAELYSLEETFYGKDAQYTRSSSSVNQAVAKSKADKTAAIVVVCYFVGIYILGDFIVGNHYIIKFFRWFLVKVCKVKFKPKKAPQESFGHDYYCQLTLALDVSALPGFSESVQIRYTPENSNDEDISFVLLKGQNYTLTQRIKAGNYVNMWIDLDKNKYATVNIPETLVVEGYQKGYRIKIIKREE